VLFGSGALYSVTVGRVVCFVGHSKLKAMNRSLPCIWVQGDRWVIEGFAPSEMSEEKDVKVTAHEMDQASSGVGAAGATSSQVSENKTGGKVFLELVRSIPELKLTDPESVLDFLVRAEEVHKLNLVSEGEFLSCLLSCTLGRVTQLLGEHLVKASNRPVARTDLFSTFLPLRIEEEFLNTRVLNKFHSLSEDLNIYLMSVKGAADVLGYMGSEIEFVDRVLQNLHHQVRSHLIFTEKPRTFSDLFVFASTEAEAVVIEKQRRSALNISAQGEGKHVQRNSLVRPLAQAVSHKGTSIVCWRCKRQGHVRLNCPSSRAQGNDFRLAAAKRVTRFQAPVDSLSRKISSRPKGKVTPWLMLTLGG
jgi:hypothetical protein